MEYNITEHTYSTPVEGEIRFHGTKIMVCTDEDKLEWKQIGSYRPTISNTVSLKKLQEGK